MIRVLLADDHALVREGIKRLFSLTTDIVVAGEAINGQDVQDKLLHGSYDIVLLDMTMPGISGPDLIARIVAHAKPPAILVLTMHNEPQIARRALSAGAAGYLTKDNNPDVLIAAVRKVASGGRFLDPGLAEAIAFASTSAHDQAPHEALSNREYQIFGLLAKGMGVNEIAEQLVISNKTVSTHKTRLMEKMGFDNTADLVRYAVAQKLID
jgi:DNA-binding NarL/FixJ family response regulator